METRKRLDNIVVKVGADFVRTYTLQYISSPSTTRSRLHSITQWGPDYPVGPNLPPLTFSYQVQPFWSTPNVVSWPNVRREGQTSSVQWNSISYGPAASRDTYLTLLDINSDGFPDRVMRKLSSPFDKFIVQFNTGSGFLIDEVDFPNVDVQGDTTGEWGSIAAASAGRLYVGLGDINGDGRPDRVMRGRLSPYVPFRVQLNNGLGFDSSIDWGPVDSQGNTDDNWRSLIAAQSDSFFTYIRADMFDINGDGLIDRVMRKDSTPYDRYKVQLNNGTGFDPVVDWLGLGSGGLLHNSVATFILWGDIYAGLYDINGDGLPDRVSSNENDGSPPYYHLVQFNNGAGFEPVENWGPVESPNNQVDWRSVDGVTSGGVGVTSLIDMNGDGLPDQVRAKNGSPYDRLKVQINHGSGFSASVDWGPLSSQGNNSASWNSISAYNTSDGSTYVAFGDINGDGLPDRIMRKITSPYDSFVVQLSNGPFPDLLSVVDNGIGGRVEVTYTSSTTFDNYEWDSINPLTDGGKCLLPFPVNAVSTVTVSDGLGGSSTSTYSYKGGMYEPLKREFRGFCIVEVTDPLGLKSRYWFHQGGGRNESAKGEFQDLGSMSKKGVPFRVEHIGSDEQIYGCTLNKVEEAQPFAGVAFPYLSKTIELNYADGVNYRATALTREFDFATGNLLKETRHGEVQLIGLVDHSWPEIEAKFQEIGDDEVYSHITYYGVGVTPPLSNADIKNKPASARTTSDSAGQQILAESLSEYYGNTGLLLSQRDRICEGNHATNGYTYDTYGNLRFHTNEVGVVSETTYDPEYQTFPRQNITGPFISTSFYDSRSGLVTDSTDISGLVSKHIHDEFFRLKEIRISSVPNGTPDVWTAKYDYTLGGIVNGQPLNSVKFIKNNALAGDPGHETWSYLDGLRRVIQTRVEAEPHPELAPAITLPFRVTDVVYDQRGETKFQTLNYFGDGSSFTKLNDLKSCTWTEFDPIGRPFKLTPSVGVTFVDGLPTENPPPALQAGEADSPLGFMMTGYSEGIDPWVITRADEEGKVRKFYLDAMGRTNRIVEVVATGTVGTPAGNYLTLFGHDKLDRVAKITDHAGSVIE
jgi:hypothetical protein